MRIYITCIYKYICILNVRVFTKHDGRPPPVHFVNLPRKDDIHFYTVIKYNFVCFAHVCCLAGPRLHSCDVCANGLWIYIYCPVFAVARRHHRPAPPLPASRNRSCHFYSPSTGPFNSHNVQSRRPSTTRMCIHNIFIRKYNIILLKVCTFGFY